MVDGGPAAGPPLRRDSLGSGLLLLYGRVGSAGVGARPAVRSSTNFPQGGPVSAELGSTIDDLFSARCDAFRRKDVAALVQMLDADYQLWVPAANAMGVGEIRRVLEADFAAYDITASYEREESIVSGGLAFERGWDVQVRVAQQSGESVTRRQRVFLVLRRRANGHWRFARGIALPGPAA